MSVLNSESFTSIEDYYYAYKINQNYELYGTDIVNTQKADAAIKAEAFNSWVTQNFDTTAWEYNSKPFSIETVQVAELVSSLMAIDSQNGKTTKKVVAAMESMTSKALYKGPTQNFFISGDTTINTVEMNAHIAQVVSVLYKVQPKEIAEVKIDKLRNYFLIKAAIAENLKDAANSL